MPGAAHTVTAELWRHPGQDGWHFVTMPPGVADELRARTAGAGRPFGMVKAQVTLGATTWSTSLFADTQRDSYLLPVKADVRRREQVGDGDVVTVTITAEGG